MNTFRTVTSIFLLVMLPAASRMASAQREQAPGEDRFDLDRCIQLFTTSSPQRSTEVYTLMNRQAEMTWSRLPLASGRVSPTVTTAVAIVASDKDGRGVISFSPNKEVEGSSTGNWNVEISAPFSKSENQAVFGSLAGLSGDINATGTYSRFLWDIDPAGYGKQICQACNDAGITSLLDCSQFGLREQVNKRFLAEESRTKGVSVAEQESIAQARTESYMRAMEDSLLQALYGPMVARVWSAEASVGRKERTFFTLEAAERKEDRIGHSFSLVGGMIFQRSSIILPRWSTFTKLTGKRDYKENDKATLCKPVTDSILENCTSQPLGRAKEEESLILSTEGRFFFRGSALGEFALAPSAQYDFEKNVWGFEAPLFLVRNSDKNFTGGVKLAWRSDQEDLVAAIFVSRALKADAP